MVCAYCGQPAGLPSCGACGRDPRVAGTWSLTEVLGRGGMGVTWRASGPDGDVAIKEIPVRTADAGALERAHREAQVLQQLRHPSIPRFIAECEHGEGKSRALYLVQELVEGHDLTQGPRLSEDEVLDVLDDVLVVLEYLHGRSPPVVHRDLKPANLRRRADGALFVVDFGAVRDALDELGGDSVAGTFGFMAPEQFGGDTDPRTDLYGLGATAVALLTRVDPSTLAGADRRLRWRHRTSASAPVAAAIDRLIAVRPSDRPSSAAEARELLRQARRDRDRPREVPVLVKVGALTAITAAFGLNLVGFTAFGAAVALIRPWALWEAPAPPPAPPPVVAPAPPPAPPVVAPKPSPSPPPAVAPKPPAPRPHGPLGRVVIAWKGKKGAKLTIDGTPAGTLPVHTQLRAGVHTFSVRDGPIEMTTEVDVALDGELTRIDLAEHW